MRTVWLTPRAGVTRVIFICYLLLAAGSGYGQIACPNQNPVVVTTAGNDGNSLQWALTCIHVDPDLSEITFDIPGEGPHFIQPTPNSPLPLVRKENAVIDATTQPNGQIIIDGSLMNEPQPGLTLIGNNIKIIGLQIQNFDIGIEILSSLNTLIARCIIHLTNYAVSAGFNTINFTAENNVLGSDIQNANFAAGIRIEGSTTAALIRNNSIAYNPTGILIFGVGAVTISENSMYCNGFPIAKETGPKPPDISRANSVRIAGSALPGHYVELFVHADNPDCVETPCQGRRFIGSAFADADGQWIIQGNLPVQDGDVVTATATFEDDTSPFSTCVPVTDVACNGIAVQVEGKDSCPNLNDGSATASVDQGIPPFNYFWSNGETTPGITGLSPGTYQVTVVDVEDCIAKAEVTIQESPLLTVDILPTHISCAGADDGSALAQIEGGIPPYSFQWSNGGIESQITGLAPGTYRVQVTDGNGCVAFASQEIFEPEPLENRFVQQDVSCFGGSDGAISVGVTGGVEPYTYSWSNGGSTPDLTGLAAGAYSLTVTDANDCVILLDFTISEPPVLIVQTSKTDETANDANDGTASSQGAGGTAPYQYNWSNGANTPNISGLQPGTYTVTVTDSQLCTVQASVVIEPFFCDLSVSVEGSNTCAGQDDGTATAFVEGGTGPFSYQWNTGPDQPGLTNLGPGLYQVTVTDANNCTASGEISIEEYPPLSVSITTTDVTCNGADNGTATAVVQGGSGPFSYAWSNGETTAAITGLAPGTYRVQVIDANGCVAFASDTLGQPPLLQSNVDQNNVNCFGGTNGAIFVTAAGGVPPYSYNWSNGVSTADNPGLSAGPYSLTITDDNNCELLQDFLISQPPALTVQISKTDETANNANDGTASAQAGGGTPPYTYNWSNGESTADIDALAPGSYTLTVTDANLCTVEASVSILGVECDIAVEVTTTPTCPDQNGGTATAVVQGGTAPLTYQWNNGEEVAGIDNLAPDLYEVTVTDAENCTAIGQATVEELPGPLVSITTIDVSCSGAADGTATAVVQGGTSPFSYLWNNNEITSSINGLIPGDYAVQVTDANGCSASAQAAITEPPALGINVDQNDVSCFDGTDGALFVGAVGGVTPYSYSWSNGVGTADNVNLGAGPYSLTVTDANDCQLLQDFTIAQPPALTVQISKTDETVNGASDGTATALAGGGTPPYTYNWSNGANTAEITGLSPATYTVTVEDANACTVEATVSILGVDCDLTVEVNATNTCSGLTGGTATAAVQGGTAPFTYQWTNGAEVANIADLGPGLYEITVTDANQCVAIGQAGVEELPAPVVTVGTTGVSCNGAADGTATAVVEGGTAPFTYLWNNNEITSSISSLAPGDYTVQVVDANGCSASSQAAISEPAALELIVDQNNVSCFGGNDGALLVEAVGGVPPYSYNWSNGVGTANNLGLDAGAYALTLTDANDCELLQDFDITQPPALTVQTTKTDETVNGANDGTASAQAGGGSPPYTYNWSNGETTADISGLAPAAYTVTVEDANSCTIEASVLILGIDCNLAVEISTTNTCADQTDGTATAAVEGGTGPYTYAWSNGATTAGIANLGPGQYEVTVTDAAQCQAIGQASVETHAVPSVQVTTTDLSCDGLTGGSATAVAEGGTAPYAYLWNNDETTPVIDNLAAGSYTVEVTDANGCAAAAQGIVAAQSSIEAGVEQADVSCFGGTDGSLVVTATGGVAPYSFSWSNGVNTASNPNLTAGTYSLTITDNGECPAILNFAITQPGLLIVDLNKTDETSSGAADGTAAAVVSGGSPPYQYSWSTGANTAEIADLTAGEYTVTVQDANGCVVQGTTTIEVGECTLGVLAETSNASCFGASDGSVNLSVEGGQAPYSYDWGEAPIQGPAAANLAPGNYTVTVSDNANCSMAMTFFIFQPNEPLTTSVSKHDESAPNAADGTIGVVASGGTPPYSFEWSNGGNTSTLSNLTVGVYELTVTDNNSCSTTRIIDITSATGLGCPAQPGTMVTTTEMQACGGDTIRAVHNGDESLEEEEVLRFILHDRNDGTVGNVFQINSEPVFVAGSGLRSGQSYYIAAAAGQRNSNGELDFNDPCLTVSNGVPLTFSKKPLPVYALQGPNLSCGNEPFDLEIDDLYPDSTVRYWWQLATGEILQGSEHILQVTPTSSAYTGEYFAARDSNGCRSDWSASLLIEVISLDPDADNAGQDTTLCNPEVVTLRAQTSGEGNGTWLALTSGDIADPVSPTTTVSGVAGGVNVFVWNVALEDCPSAFTDTIRIQNDKPPRLADDQFTLQKASEILVMNVLLNDQLEGIEDSTLTAITQPAFGNLEYLPEEHSFRYFVDEARRGQVQFDYLICSESERCGSVCDTATVVIDVLSLPDVPEAITPNADGRNDNLIIKGIEGFGRIEILITNRYGDIIFEEKEYDNNNPWRGGKGRSGKTLPQGAYYYVLKAYENEVMVGEPQTGVIHIFL